VLGELGPESSEVADHREQRHDRLSDAGLAHCLGKPLSQQQCLLREWWESASGCVTVSDEAVEDEGEVDQVGFGSWAGWCEDEIHLGYQWLGPGVDEPVHRIRGYLNHSTGG
jgi:hypothetical protein